MKSGGKTRAEYVLATDYNYATATAWISLKNFGYVLIPVGDENSANIVG